MEPLFLEDCIARVLHSDELVFFQSERAGLRNQDTFLGNVYNIDMISYQHDQKWGLTSHLTYVARWTEKSLSKVVQAGFGDKIRLDVLANEDPTLVQYFSSLLRPRPD